MSQLILAMVLVYSQLEYIIEYSHMSLSNQQTLNCLLTTTFQLLLRKIDVSCKYNNACKPLRFIVTDELPKTIIGKRDEINLKCIQFLDRATVDYVKSINPTTHPMIVAKKKWNNGLQIGKNGDAKKKFQSVFPELFQCIGCVKNTYKISCLISKGKSFSLRLMLYQDTGIFHSVRRARF